MRDITLAALFDEMSKIAAVDVVTDPASAPTEREVAPVHREHPLMTAAKGVGGFALGAGVGFAGAHGADRAIKALGGHGVPLSVIRYGAPIAGAASGLGFSLLQHKILQKIKSSREAAGGLKQSTGG